MHTMFESILYTYHVHSLMSVGDDNQLQYYMHIHACEMLTNLPKYVYSMAIGMHHSHLQNVILHIVQSMTEISSN